MTLTRRLAAGLPAAGVTVLAALALAGSPANATGDEAAARAKPAVMTTPCSEAERGAKCAYGHDDEAPSGPGATPDDNGTGPTRGSGGYGGESPTPSPSPSTPTASVDTVPPGGAGPATSPAPSTPGGVSAGGTLPLTGAPMGLTIALGGLMVIGGASAVYYARRRRGA